jgi:hypothetical protein
MREKPWPKSNFEEKSINVYNMKIYCIRTVKKYVFPKCKQVDIMNIDIFSAISW